MKFLLIVHNPLGDYALFFPDENAIQEYADDLIDPSHMYISYDGINYRLLEESYHPGRNN